MHACACVDCHLQASMQRELAQQYRSRVITCWNESPSEFRPYSYTALWISLNSGAAAIFIAVNASSGKILNSNERTNCSWTFLLQLLTMLAVLSQGLESLTKDRCIISHPSNRNEIWTTNRSTVCFVIVLKIMGTLTVDYTFSNCNVRIQANCDVRMAYVSVLLDMIRIISLTLATVTLLAAVQYSTALINVSSVIISTHSQFKENPLLPMQTMIMTLLV